jgi:hypothetical protein
MAQALAVDGNTSRRSFGPAAGASPLHVVTSFAARQRLLKAKTRSSRRALLGPTDPAAVVGAFLLRPSPLDSPAGAAPWPERP